MTIRKIIQEDYGDLLEIARSAVETNVEAPEVEKTGILEGIRGNLKLACTSAIEGVFLTAIENEEPFGFILIKDYWNLSDLFVLPRFQSKGTGRELWIAARPLCVAHSDRPATRVNSSLNAVGFYESLGFRETTVEQQLPTWVIPMTRELGTAV